ncbi:hypothetical protein [Bosea sp. TAB14]|uniref:hypothetical protein n=1 Tax=Bosea sp. TAB14 TaxID=3237481 RepID=UPI003F8FAD30
MSKHDDRAWNAAYRARRPDTADTGLMSNGVAVLIGDAEFPADGHAASHPDVQWDRVRLLREELRLMRQGWQPSDAELATARTLTDAVQIIDDDSDLPVLIGMVGDDIVQTDSVAAIDVGGRRWARTVSCWVRLLGSVALREGDPISPVIIAHFDRGE